MVGDFLERSSRRLAPAGVFRKFKKISPLWIWVLNLGEKCSEKWVFGTTSTLVGLVGGNIVVLCTYTVGKFTDRYIMEEARRFTERYKIFEAGQFLL